MEDVICPRDTILTALVDSAMDSNLADDLLLEGYWLETTDCSDFLFESASTSALFSSCFLPSSDINNINSNINPEQNNSQDEVGKSLVPDNLNSFEVQPGKLIGTHSFNQNMAEIGECATPLESYPADADGNVSGVITSMPETRRRWLIDPRANLGPPSSVKERLIQALNHIKECRRDGDVLVQIWVPIKAGNRNVLTTYGQPFWHCPNSQRLVNYRMASTKFQFSADENSSEALGLPGRVFLGRLPEWTPDVRYFSSDEYPRVGHARRNGVRGTLALPFFELGSRACMGVVEVIMTSQKINYGTELENICNALQAVNLRGSEVLNVPYMKEGSDSYQVALPEILEVLRAACEAHRLPLAQTWVPCIQQGKKGSRHSVENYANCVSTVDVACYVTDPHIWGFHEACSEHHLFKGQGVAGKAFTTNQPCFSTNITAFSKSEYPLSHYAKMYALRAAVAIRLRCIYTGVLDYVLEFFLPVQCQDSEEQKLMLNSLSVIIQQVCRGLRIVTDKELEDENTLTFDELAPVECVLHKSFPNEDGGPSGQKTPSFLETSLEESLWLANTEQTQRKGKSVICCASMPSEFQLEEAVGFNPTTQWEQPGEVFTEFKQHYLDSAKENVHIGEPYFGKQKALASGKATEKRRAKSDKNISLQVLQQYFAGSLKEAAKSIGVCPTTLKRICRQHGITRWPSRKIKKVGHSLRKLQVVLDSVQGAAGSLELSSLYANFPKAHGSNLSSPGFSINASLSSLNQMGPSTTLNTQPQSILRTDPTASRSPSSSCSQSSSSSLSCSSGAKQTSSEAPPIATEDRSKEDNQRSVLKRAYSDAELHVLIKEPRPPPRSHSHKSLSVHSTKSFSPVPKSNTCLPRDRVFRVKVAYGEEKIRFSLQASWGFEDLIQEIRKRFNLEEMSLMDLKYLDDESEWVLLTCDADLQECKDISKTSQVHAIKLSLHHKHVSSRRLLGSTGGFS